MESKEGLFSLSHDDFYLKKELDHRIYIDHLFSKIAHAFKVSDEGGLEEAAPTKVTKFSCLRQMIRDFIHYCKHGERLSDYDLHKTQLFVKICEIKRPLNIKDTLTTICPS